MSGDCSYGISEKRAIKKIKSPEVIRLQQVISENIGVSKVYDDTTANGLTICIIDFIKIIKKQQAERFHSGGIPYIDPTTKKQKFAKPITTSGTADLHCTIKGKSVKIEVKTGNDRQSENQKAYQKSIEKAGGIYFIARDFSSFSWWYKKTFE